MEEVKLKHRIRKMLFISVISGIILNSTVFAAGTVESASMTAFVEGCNAYSEGNWKESIFMLKKAASYSENNTPETYYMLISAEIYAKENQSALSDCNYFVENFSDSIYMPQIQYLRGKVLFNLGEYENSIVELSDFCHQYESHSMYPVALYWIGEALFACEKYDEAQSVFERLIADYPDNSKVAAAQFKIESIAQRAREEKLLYLLKQTGEEYLAAKEDYEKQLKLYNNDAVYSTRQKLNEAQKKNEDLEEQVRILEQQIELLKKDAQSVVEANSEPAASNQKKALSSDSGRGTQTSADASIASYDSIKILKEKALQAQRLLDEKTED